MGIVVKFKMRFLYNISITRIKFINRCAQVDYEARGSCRPSCFSDGHANGHGSSAHRAAQQKWRRSSSLAGRSRKTWRAWASLYSRVVRTKRQRPSVEVSWSVMMARENYRLSMFMFKTDQWIIDQHARFTQTHEEH